MSAATASVKTYSRFACLEEDSEEEERIEKEVEKKNNAEKNAKKRAKKKKKAVAQTNDLRNLAFSKPVSAKAIQNVHQQRHATEPVTGVTNGVTNGTPSLLTSIPSLGIPTQNGGNIPIENMDVNWEEWKNKDEEFVVDKFQRDLEIALRQSNGSQQPQVKKVKNKVKTMSLEEFVAVEEESSHTYEQAPAIPQLDSFYLRNGYSPEELDPNHYDTCIDPSRPVAPPQTTSSTIPIPKKKKKKRKPTTDNKALSEVLEELHTEEPDSSPSGTEQILPAVDAASFASWQNEIEEKNKEIHTLNDLNEKLKDELGQVKKRNKQFCFILAQGEMKDKSDILLQVDELTNIKNELSEELAGMHILLEQERSKVSSLKVELSKQQTLRTKSKSTSEEK